jgi:hypothetical protein
MPESGGRASRPPLPDEAHGEWNCATKKRFPSERPRQTTGADDLVLYPRWLIEQRPSSPPRQARRQTVLVHTFGLITVTHAMGYLVARFRMRGRYSRTLAMISMVIGPFAVMITEIWLWAGLYRLLDIFANFETAPYFSTITFSTIGYGDVVPVHAMARAGGTGGSERISAHCLVDGLPDCGGNAHPAHGSPTMEPIWG